jgi:hypothetical protein
MRWTALILAAATILVSAGDALAAPKTSAGGNTCISTGTARKVGQDQNGNKLDCLWDTCTYCAVGTSINCSKLTTEYSNARDCHAAAAGSGSAGVVTRPPGGLSAYPGKLEPTQPTKPKRPVLPIYRGPLKLNNGGGGAGIQ